MKVLIISYAFPPCATGAATLMYNLCKYLPKRCYTVITTKEEFCINRGTCDKEYVLNCSTIRLPVCTDTTPDNLKFFLLTIFKGLLLNKKERIDCILAVYPYIPDLLAAYALHKLIRKPFLIHMQDPFSETRSGWKHGIWKVLEEKIFLSASKILVTNEVFKNHYLKRGIRNVIVFPTPIDLDKSRSAITSRTKPFQRYLKIVFTGSVYGPHETPVLAFLEAVKEIKNVRVVFAVPSKKGCLKDHLKDHLKNVNIGFLSKKKCLELQRSADVLFLPLSYEYRYSFLSFPCKVLEYLAAGKPILALVPKKSFMEDLIKNHEVGIVVTEFSAEKIVDAIEELRDEEKRKKFSQNALQTARLFEAKIRSKQLCSLLNDLVSNQKSLRSRDKD